MIEWDAMPRRRCHGNGAIPPVALPTVVNESARFVIDTEIVGTDWPGNVRLCHSTSTSVSFSPPSPSPGHSINSISI